LVLDLMDWRLLTIRPSHYNERARWALDRFELAYDEVPYMPMLHAGPIAVALLPAGKGRSDRISTRLSTPVLIADGQTIADSGAIVAWVSRRFGDRRTSLHWTPRAAELEQQFADRLGADTRRLVYRYLLDDVEGMRELAERNVPRSQARLFIALLPAIRRTIRDKLHVDDEHTGRSLVRIDEAFAAVGDRLADGRPYLLGDRFSAADLGFAALAAPALLVQPSEGYGAWLPPVDRTPPAFAAIVRRLRDTPAGRFALRMFAEERGRRITPCFPIP
jgi:glutathione S-transferase